MTGVEERPFYFGLTSEDPYERDPAEIRFQLLVPSLENMSAVKLALELFVQKWTKKDSRPFYTSVVDRVRNEVLSDISIFKLPTSLKEKLSYDVVRVGKELNYFISFFRSPEDDDLVSRLDIKNIIWTSRGQIDFIDTAELIRNAEGINQKVRDFSWYYLKNGWDPTVVYGMTDGWCLDRPMSDAERANYELFWEEVFDDEYFMSFSKGIFLNKNIWFNQSHSMIRAYFNCTSNVERMRFVCMWLTCMHGTFFLLAKLTGKMQKFALFSSYFFKNHLLINSLQEDYFFQMVTMEAGLRMSAFNFMEIAFNIEEQRTNLKDWPLACNYYTIFYDKFVEFLSQNVTDDNEMAYCYLLLHRDGMDFVEIKSILSRVDPIKRTRLLQYEDCSVYLFVLREKGLDILKMVVEYCCCGNKVDMETVANQFAKCAKILSHYYDSNDFNGFMSFFNWINSITPPNSRYSPEDSSLTYLSSCIERDRDNFVASCQNGCYSMADEEVYHISNGVLNWICRYNQEMVEQIKLQYIRKLMRCSHVWKYGKFYKDFNDRMIPWLCNHENILQLRNLKNRTWNGKNSLIACFHC